MTDPIKLAWLEDHRHIRTALLGKFRKAGGFEFVVNAATLETFEYKIVEVPDLDVALLDLKIVGTTRTGLDTIATVKDYHPHCRIAVLSNFIGADSAFAGKAYDEGVQGFFEKTDKSKEIIDAVRRLSRGEPLVSTPGAQEVVARIIGAPGHAEAVWNWFTPAQRVFLHDLARSSAVMKQDFVESQPTHPSTIRDHLKEIREVLRDHKVLEVDEDLRWERLRTWAREKHFDLRIP